MIKHLYNNFAHWYHGGTIYFYSDPHFNDDEMKYIRKNYIGDDEQIRAINKKVGKNDTVIFLGDIGDVEFIRKIRGYKVLVMGNHDGGASNYLRTVDENGVELRVVDRWYPSSKLCHCCGHIKTDLKLSDRIYRCDCGYVEDRDLNASLNLRDATTYKIA